MLNQISTPPDPDDQPAAATGRGHAAKPPLKPGIPRDGIPPAQTTPEAGHVREGASPVNRLRKEDELTLSGTHHIESDVTLFDGNVMWLIAGLALLIGGFGLYMLYKFFT